MQDAQDTVTVWAAARDIPEGAVITSTDLRVAEVKLPGDLLAGYALSSTELEGTVATRSVAAGELFSTVWLAGDAELESGRVISIPLQPEHAVGGTLRTGDRIDILATFDAGEARSRTVVLAQGVEVQEIVRAAGLIEDQGQIGVTVSLDEVQSTQIVFAIRNGDIDVVRITGLPGTHSATTVTGEDLP